MQVNISADTTAPEEQQRIADAVRQHVTQNSAVALRFVHIVGPKWGAAHGQPPPAWYQHLPDWLTGLYPYDLYINFPANLVEIIIPSILMIGLPALLIYVLWRIRWVNTRRDVLLSLFTGFIVAYWTMTIIGSLFRGASQELVWPWHVPHIDG